MKKGYLASALIGFIAGTALTAGLFYGFGDNKFREDSLKERQKNAGGAFGSKAAGLLQPDPMMEIMEFRDRLARNPGDRDALMALANANMMIKRFDEADRLYTYLLELDPRHLDARTNLALIRLEKGEPRRAIELLEKNLELSPTDDATLFNMGVIYLYDLKEPEQAMATWETWLGAHPDAPASGEIRRKIEEIKKGIIPRSAG